MIYKSKKKKVDKDLIKVLLVFVIGVVLVLLIPILFSLFIVK
jgi:tetrahydromethanopterin S-methyltransferase subunit G